MSATYTAEGLRVTRPSNRFTDTEHGFLREWGVSGRLTESRSLSMGYGKLNRGLTAAAHCHDVETAIYIIAGKARVRFGPTLVDHIDVQAGDFIFIPPDVVHCPETISEVPMEYVVARNSPVED